MSSRLYRPKRDDKVFVGQDVLREHAHKIATEQLIPRIAVENQIAVETIETQVYFYQKIPLGSGRRCSCFDVEVSPDSHCNCCYGTGIVGGYWKHGTHLEVLDVTHPSIRAANVFVDQERRSRPRHFILIPGATRGYLISRMRPKTNIGEIDHIYAQTQIPDGTDITASVKAPTDTEWVEMTKDNLAQRLYNPWIDLRIDLFRASVSAPSPRVAFVFVRYSYLEDKVIRANIPRATKSNMLQEFGVMDDWQTQTFWTDNTLRKVTTEDWFAQVSTGTRWKIISVSDFAPEGKLLSWEADTRLVQKYHSQRRYPL